MGKIRMRWFGGRTSGRVCMALAALLAAALHPPMVNADTATGGPLPPVRPVQKVPGSTRGGAAPAPVQVVPAQNKPITIQLHPGIFAPNDQMLLKTDLKPAAAELQEALRVTRDYHLNQVAEWLSKYQKQVDICLNFPFTPEHQKKAGCTGTDTLNQCSEKLFWHCVDFPAHGFELAKAGMLKSLERLQKAMNGYSAKLKLIPIK